MRLISGAVEATVKGRSCGKTGTAVRENDKTSPSALKL